MTSQQSPDPDLMTAGLAILEAAAARGLTVRAFGGFAVWLTCAAARSGPFVREYKDLDLVGLSRERRLIAELLETCGYTPDAEFNLFQGATRLMYLDELHGRNVDVFLDRLNMCHMLRLDNRLGLTEMTLTPADLLLTKLQIVQTNERDYIDALALLADAEVDRSRVAAVLRDDWGWWRTATEVLERIAQYGAALGPSPERDRALAALVELRAEIDRAPHSLRWRLRARVGERVQWYELPEEVADPGANR